MSPDRIDIEKLSDTRCKRIKTYFQTKHWKRGDLLLINERLVIFSHVTISEESVDSKEDCWMIADAVVVVIDEGPRTIGYREFDELQSMISIANKIDE